MGRIFDGGTTADVSNMTAGNGSFMNGLTNLWVSGWVFRPAVGSKNWLFVCKPTGYTLNHCVAAYWYDNNNIYLDIGQSSGGGRLVSSTATGWNHLGFQFVGGAANGSRLLIYLNGVLQSTSGAGDTTQPTTLSSSLGSHTVRMGSYNLGTAAEFETAGSIHSDLLVFGGDLSASVNTDLRMAAMYHPHQLAANPDCFSYYPYDTVGSTEPDVCGRQACSANSVKYSILRGHTWRP